MNIRLTFMSGFSGQLTRWEAKLIVNGRGALRAEWRDDEGGQVVRTKPRHDFGLSVHDFESVFELLLCLRGTGPIMDDAPSRWITCVADGREVSCSRQLGTSPAEAEFEKAWRLLVARVLPVLAELGVPTREIVESATP